MIDVWSSRVHGEEREGAAVCGFVTLLIRCATRASVAGRTNADAFFDTPSFCNTFLATHTCIVFAVSVLECLCMDKKYQNIYRRDVNEMSSIINTDCRNTS